MNKLNQPHQTLLIQNTVTVESHLACILWTQLPGC